MTADLQGAQNVRNVHTFEVMFYVVNRVIFRDGRPAFVPPIFGVRVRCGFGAKFVIFTIGILIIFGRMLQIYRVRCGFRSSRERKSYNFEL